MQIPEQRQTNSAPALFSPVESGSLQTERIFRRQQASYLCHGVNFLSTWRLTRKQVMTKKRIIASMTERTRRGTVTATGQQQKKLFPELPPCTAHHREKSCRSRVQHYTLQVTQTFHPTLHTGGNNVVDQAFIARHCTLQVTQIGSFKRQHLHKSHDQRAMSL